MFGVFVLRWVLVADTEGSPLWGCLYNTVLLLVSQLYDCIPPGIGAVQSNLEILLYSSPIPLFRSYQLHRYSYGSSTRAAFQPRKQTQYPLNTTN
jgi:hypothetical protein